MIRIAVTDAHEASAHAERLVTPSLVAIYTWIRDSAPEQIGTGFLINHGGRPVLVTARHVLYGHKYDEDPCAKYVWLNGDLRQLDELQSKTILRYRDNDIAAMYADELGLPRCLPMSCLSPTETTCALITIYGLLRRDFRRKLSARSIRPQPWRVTNERVAWKPGSTAIRYQKNQWIDARTEQTVHGPRPEGMSGAPMLDTKMLALAKVVIVGIFTDYVQEKGLGFGESTPKVIALLEQLRPPE